MHINISTSEANKGSSNELVHYLEKENRQAVAAELWFTGGQQTAEAYEVRRAIDNNIAKLSQKDAKYFLINISPSQKEIKHLIDQYGEKEAAIQLKGYTEKMMDAYAKNFNRPGIGSHKDLLWFGKLEHYRYYQYQDKEVKTGERKRGGKKPGEQWHVQVIVSRKDKTNKIKLSPMNNSRGSNAKHSQKLGQFDRVAFKQCGEELFDHAFSFNRKLEETMAYSNILKNGNLADKEKLEDIKTGLKINPEAKGLAFKLIRTLHQQQTKKVKNQVKAIAGIKAETPKDPAENLFNLLLKERSDVMEAGNLQQFKRKKKKKRNVQGLSRQKRRQAFRQKPVKATRPPAPVGPAFTYFCLPAGKARLHTSARHFLFFRRTRRRSN